MRCVLTILWTDEETEEQMTDTAIQQYVIPRRLQKVCEM